MADFPDISILMGMTDREIREAIAKGDEHGNAVLAAMVRERRGNGPSQIDGGTFRYGNTTQLQGEMLICRREAVEPVMAIAGSWGGCLARMPDGEILLIDSNQKMMVRSSDEGRSWSEPRKMPAPAGDLNNLGALGALRDGTVLVAGMQGLLPLSQRDPEKLGPPIDGIVCRSTDGGRTFGEPFLLDRMNYHCLEPASHLRFCELQDGTVLLGVTGNTTRTASRFFYNDGTEVPPSGSLVRPEFRDHDQWVYFSRDGGRTFGDPVLLAPWGSETNFVQLPSGKILATIRYQREWAVEGDDSRVLAASCSDVYPDFGCTIFIETFLSESTDGGLSWTEPRKASRYLEHPSDIVQLSDGTLVMIMGHKGFPMGPTAVWSHDEGRTWSDHFVQLHMDPIGSAGQTTALALPDDTILVSYETFIWDPESVARRDETPQRGLELWTTRFRLPAEARL
jgi:hypothetical protein